MKEEVLKTEEKDKKNLNYKQIYEEYVLWFAMPLKAKESMGIENDIQFAQLYGMADRTLRKWKDRPDFELEVRKLRRKWAFEKTGHVIEGIYRSAVKGNDKSQKLWMQVFEGFTEKTENTQIVKVELNPGDIRFIIDGFPENLKEKYYGYLREIMDAAVALRDGGQLQDGTPTGTYIEAVVSESSDNNAQDVSSKRANAVAIRHTKCVCEDVGNVTDRSTLTSKSYY